MALSDPTLSSCCARDLKEQRQAAKLRGALAAADRAAAPALERAAPRDPRAVAAGLERERTAAAAAAAARRSSRDGSDDSDEGEAIARLREARLAELRRRAASRAADAGEGFGRLVDVGAAAPASALAVAAASGSPCVLHLAADGHDAGAQLDERLAELARALMPAAARAGGGGGGGGGGGSGGGASFGRRRRRQQGGGGVLFLRAPIGAAAAPSAAGLALCRDLGLAASAGARSLPALVVLAPGGPDELGLAASGGGGGGGGGGGDEEGSTRPPPVVVAVACAPVARFCADGALVEDRVDAFLRRAGVLPNQGSGSGSRGSDDEEGGDEEEEGDGDRPCELCGRTYPHEHVRAVYGRRDSDQEGASGD